MRHFEFALFFAYAVLPILLNGISFFCSSGGFQTGRESSLKRTCVSCLYSAALATVSQRVYTLCILQEDKCLNKKRRVTVAETVALPKRRKLEQDEACAERKEKKYATVCVSFHARKRIRFFFPFLPHFLPHSFLVFQHWIPFWLPCFMH